MDEKPDILLLVTADWDHPLGQTNSTLFFGGTRPSCAVWSRLGGTIQPTARDWARSSA